MIRSTLQNFILTGLLIFLRINITQSKSWQTWFILLIILLLSNRIVILLLISIVNLRLLRINLGYFLFLLFLDLILVILLLNSVSYILINWIHHIIYIGNLLIDIICIILEPWNILFYRVCIILLLDVIWWIWGMVRSVNYITKLI